MSEPIKSNYPHTLNALSSMQNAFNLAAYKSTLRDAENAIVALESELSASQTADSIC